VGGTQATDRTILENRPSPSVDRIRCLEDFRVPGIPFPSLSPALGFLSLPSPLLPHDL